MIITITIIIGIIHLLIIKFSKKKEHLSNIINHTRKDNMYVNPENIESHQIINEPYDISSAHIVNDRNSPNETSGLRIINSYNNDYSYINNINANLLRTNGSENNFNQLKKLQKNDLLSEFANPNFKIIGNTSDGSTLSNTQQSELNKLKNEFTVTVPLNKKAGEQMIITHPKTGKLIELQIPSKKKGGDTFKISLPN